MNQRGIDRNFAAERAMSYAAKWFAEHDNAEPPFHEDITNEALARCFAYCVRPAKANEYDAIRAAILAYLRENDEIASEREAYSRHLMAGGSFS